MNSFFRSVVVVFLFILFLLWVLETMNVCALSSWYLNILALNKFEQANTYTHAHAHAHTDRPTHIYMQCSEIKQIKRCVKYTQWLIKKNSWYFFLFAAFFAPCLPFPKNCFRVIERKNRKELRKSAKSNFNTIVEVYFRIFYCFVYLSLSSVLRLKNGKCN